MRYHNHVIGNLLFKGHIVTSIQYFSYPLIIYGHEKGRIFPEIQNFFNKF